MSIFFYGCVTLDGYLAGKDHNLDWLYETGCVEETGYSAFYRAMDITLMGRRTFRALSRSGDPASVYPTTQNYVFTHREFAQAGFTPVNCGVAPFTERLGTDKNIWVIGGNTILAPLLNQNLVDHLILQIAPVLLGDGIPLFSQDEALRRFQLEEVRRYGQFAELVYRKA